MEQIGLIERMNAVAATPLLTITVALIMVAIGIVFVAIYKTGQKTERDIQKVENQYIKELAARECEIEVEKSKCAKKLWENSQLMLENKLLKNALCAERSRVSNLEYRIDQLLKGAQNLESNGTSDR